MRIQSARNLGFCPGVRRAFQLAEQALESSRCPVFLLGDLVHNRQAVENLVARGARKIEHPEEAKKGSVVVSRSHGLEKSAGESIRRCEAEVVDTTCPRVKKVHSLARQLEQNGYTILILGNPAHAEVAALISHLDHYPLVTGEKPAEWETLRGVLADLGKPVAVLEQTTFPQPVFNAFTAWVTQQSFPFSIEIHNTLCPETGQRQQELVTKIDSGEVSVVVLLGGKHSSNTRALSLIAERSGTRIYWIESAGEIDWKWFRSDDRVFLISGASTPDDQVRLTHRKLKYIAAYWRRYSGEYQKVKGG